MANSLVKNEALHWLQAIIISCYNKVHTPIESCESDSSSSHFSFATKQKSASGMGGWNLFDFITCLMCFLTFSSSWSDLGSGLSMGKGSANEEIGTSAMKGQYSPRAMSSGSVVDDDEMSELFSDMMITIKNASKVFIFH